MNRTPPKEVTEALRKEVNFGCPVHGCGVPYLTWHHFDPPWSVRQHHNPEGMIALCAKHAAFADAERYTPEQLREMKMKPFITCEEISENYDYLRRKVVCVIGNVVYNAQTALEINGEQVIGFNIIDNDGYSRLNLFIRDKDNNPILIMEDNFWTAFRTDLFDLRCSLRGRELEIISKDKQTFLFIRYDDYTRIGFKRKMGLYSKIMENIIISSTEIMKAPKWMQQYVIRPRSMMMKPINDFVSAIGSPEIIPTLTINGKLLLNGVHLAICDGVIRRSNKRKQFWYEFRSKCKNSFQFRW